MESNSEVALITGASRGIGKAVALALGAQGVTVIGTATSEAGATRITGAIEEHGIKGQGSVLDVTDAAAVEALVGEVDDDPLAVEPELEAVVTTQ